MQLLYYSALTLFFQYKTEIFNLGVLNYQFIADKLLKFFALNQFLSANKQNKGAVRRSQQSINFVYPYIAVLGCLFDCQGYFQMNNRGICR